MRLGAYANFRIPGAKSSPTLEPNRDISIEIRCGPDFHTAQQRGASIAELRRMPRGIGNVFGVALVLAALAAGIRWPHEMSSRAVRIGEGAGAAGASASRAAANPVDARRRADFAAMRTFRPGYTFWQHIFTMPDHSVAFGSAVDGRLLATFPAKGDWMRKAVWADPAIDRTLEGQQLARKLNERREQVALLLELAAGPIVHNRTRGDALRMNAGRYGPFLEDWGAIYERFGVPAEIGLAQVILESGLSATKRSEANAVGFCQWLQRNWKRLNHFSPTPIDGPPPPPPASQAGTAPPPRPRWRKAPLVRRAGGDPAVVQRGGEQRETTLVVPLPAQQQPGGQALPPQLLEAAGAR